MLGVCRYGAGKRYSESAAMVPESDARTVL